MSDCRKCVDFEWCAKHEDCGLFKPRPQTNADRIRSMTDEELTEWYYTDPFEPDPWCTPNNVQCRHKDLMAKKDEAPCKICFLAWLKQEVIE